MSHSCLVTKQADRRSINETLVVQLLVHTGFSIKLISRLPLRNNLAALGESAVHRCINSMNQPLAFEDKDTGWAKRPCREKPGQAVRSYEDLAEYSLLASIYHYLFEDKVYEGLTIYNVIQAYDFYSDMRGDSEEGIAKGTKSKKITPDSAYYISRELYEHNATIPFCKSCNPRFYSSAGQLLINVCPFCREVSDSDVMAIHT